MCCSNHFRRVWWLGVLALCCAGTAFSGPSVVDDEGVTVSLSSPARRIVSLAPSLTEMLFAVGAGDRVVGAVEYSDYPPEAKTIPRVGGSHGATALDLERIVALRPDLVVAWSSGNTVQAVERLRRLGLTVYSAEPRRLEIVAGNMARLAVLAGVENEGMAAARRFREDVAALRRRYAGRAPVRVFYQIWHQPLMTLNGEHLIGEVIALCGGVNIFAELPVLAPQVDLEAVVVANPQVIIASGVAGERPQWLDEWPRWSRIDAVRGDHIYTIHPDLIQRQGPRVIQGAEQMCRHIEQVRSG